MISIRYLIKRMKNSNFSRYTEAAKRISKITGRMEKLLLIDMIISTLKYGAGPVDYETFAMYEMKAKERGDVLTIGKNNELVKRLNNPKYLPYFEDKYEFIKKFDKYIKRSWAMIDDSTDRIEAFLSDKEKIIVKPLDESCGKGIRIIDLTNYASKHDLLEELKADGTPLMEEVVVQGSYMNNIYNNSVNTVRIITILNGGKVNLVAGCLRVGRNGNYVDNFNNGGIACIIDCKTGHAATDGYDKYRKQYEVHPDTGVKFKEFKVPNWDKVKELLDEAANIVPEVRYVGWDIAFDKDNMPFLIEGNGYPGQDVTQYPKLGIGNYKVMKEALGENEQN